MTPELVLLVLRLLSAVLLLAFIGLITWLIYQDIRTVQADQSDRQRHYGSLRIIANSSPSPPVDTLFPLLPVTSIGRGPINTIVLDDEYTSGEHALITLRGRQWWLEDLDSRNGTLLNGLPLENGAVISPGDVVTVGNARLKVEF